MKIADDLEGPADPDRTMEKEIVVFPTSFAQQRLWFLDRLEPGSSTYNIAQAFRLTGPLQCAALEQSLNEIVRRHEILRTTFVESEGEPKQIIAAAAHLPLRVISLLQISAGQRETEARRWIEEEAERPFDLTQGPLFHPALLKLDEEKHILLFAMHHIVSDGWSMVVLYRELSSLYKTFSQGKVASLPELPIQHADFSVWQHQWLQGEVLEKQLSYWKRQLSAIPVLELPTDHPRPAAQTFSGARQSFALPQALSDGLKALSRRERATSFMTLLAAFQTLLHRYTGQDDIVVGSPIAGRTRPEVEELIGLFINTLAFRGDLSGDPKFTELLARVRDAALDAYEHQELPFEKLVAELRPERDPSRSPLVQVMFAFQNIPRAALALTGLEISPIKVESDTAKFDLTLGMAEAGETLNAELEYNTDLFEHATIQRMIGHFQTLLEGIVANPEKRLSELSILTDAERRQLLFDWNDTKRDYPKDKCIHELFEEQVERTPDAVALIFHSTASGHSENELLTYRELNARANQLAHYLKKLGVGAEILVGLCVERSLEMIVGMLGILKAGGAYLPLDPAYPKDRLAFMLRDAKAPAVLTQRQLVERLPSDRAHIVCLDVDWDAIALEPEKNLVRAAAPENLVYVIYTSGSTGRPKGVEIAHKSLVNYICVLCETFGLGPGDRGLQFSSISFDSSAEEIFHCLAHGATLVLRTDAMLSSPRAFMDRCREWGVTMLPLPTAYWHELAAALSAGEAALPEQVRFVHVGGERIVPQRAAEWRKGVGGGARLVNGYGPTETAVVATMYDVDKRDPAILSSREVPIGRPIANVQTYLLDRYRNPAPIGVPGELHIGGVGLARGYLNRPELTAEKFIPHPFSDEPGARLYKTGDLARYLPDGNIEFLGRIDDQVKIRGFRVEPGEIEAALCLHPAVREAVVVAREDDANLRSKTCPEQSRRIENPKSTERRLIAYVVPQPESLPTVGELRSFLKSRLPDYMIPSRFVLLEALPLTANGKVNRAALPHPLDDPTEREGAFIRPRSPVERALAGIFAAVLGMERIGVHDNFFDLGGHSLLAAQAVSRMRAALQVEIPLRTLFESPTVAGLAEYVETALRAARSQQPAPLEPALRDGPLPLSFAQQRLWFIDRLTPESFAYNISAAFRLTGPLQATALERSLNEITRRHEALRTTFALREEQPVQVIAPETIIALPVADLQDYPESELEARAERLMAEEARRSFDLARGPLLRCHLWRLAPQDHILLLTMHHIVSDGWSMGVLYRELSSLYETFSQGKAPSLPELPIQYADYAVWQRQWLQRTVLEEQLSYWKKRLEGIPVLELPTDRARPAVQSYRGAQESFALPKALSDELKALSRREETTLFMTLLAAFQTLLHRYTGQEDIVAGSPIAGRSRVEVEGLIGFFVNTLAFRGDLSGNPSFRELMARARRTSLEAYEHQDLPFEKLVEELRPDRDPSRSPLLQVMFALQNAPTAPLALPGLSVSPVEIGGETAKFDLTLSIRETAGSLTAVVEYNTDLFDAARINRMLAHFQALLQGIVANPDQRLSELPILTEAERRQILFEWNDTIRDYPKDKCVHELFEAQAERTPDAVAVVFPSTGSGHNEKRALTYRELNRRANQLAHYLRKLGVQPEARVGVYMERSLEMVVAFLAILKAGGAYVPLDLDYPGERVGSMLADSQAGILLTQKWLLDRLPDWRGEFVGLDPDWEPFAREPDENPAGGATAENLAYVIYTSGSTAAPKGIAVPHRAITRLVINSDYVSVEPDDVVAQASNCSFDAATFEIWGALLNGARLLGIQTGALLSPDKFAAQIEQDKISALFLTTALFNEMSRQVPAAFKNMRHLLFGGEAADPGCVVEILRHAPPKRLLHVYGPTETTTFASWHLVKSVAQGATTIPIGRPIANTEIYLLDHYLNPVPIGVPGEIYIGGDGVARGYLNHPELTAERLIRHPFSDDPTARLYKTGDLGRYLPDGNIEFLGRIDDQVKIRGFRVEPGEIESALEQNPAVRQALVMARDDTSSKRLVAYVVSSQKPAPSSRDLRDFLNKKLPRFMIPSLFVFVDSFPLTPNGKVNRSALPHPGQAGADDRPAYVAPAGPVEEELARIWEELLGVRPIGVDDDFFDLGGHSLLAIRMMHRIEQACDEKLPLTALLAGPTIKQLAEALLKQRVETDRPLLVKVRAGGTERPLFFLYGDFKRGGFYCLKLARRLGPDRPFYALAPHGVDDSSIPDSVEAMAASYIRMVRAVQPEGPYLLGGYCNGGTVAFEMAQQLRRNGQPVDLVVLVVAPARNALAKRLARHFIDGLGSLLRLGPEKRLRLFLGLRAGAKLIRRPYRRARGFNTNRRSHLHTLLLRSLSSYVPQPYPGRVVLFWPSEMVSSFYRDATLGWGRAVPQIEVRLVPGNHETCVANYAEVLGDRMKTCLEEAQGKKQPASRLS